MAMGSARAEEGDPAEPSADQKGFYATLGLGAAWPQNVTGDTTVLGIPVNGNYGLNGGFAGEIGAGYDFGPVRTELTYTYTNANLNSLSGSAPGVNLGSPPNSNRPVNTNPGPATASGPPRRRVLPPRGPGVHWRRRPGAAGDRGQGWPPPAAGPLDGPTAREIAGQATDPGAAPGGSEPGGGRNRSIRALDCPC